MVSEFPFLYRFTVLLNSGGSNSSWSEFWSEFPHLMGMGGGSRTVNCLSGPLSVLQGYLFDALKLRLKFLCSYPRFSMRNEIGMKVGNQFPPTLM